MKRYYFWIPMVELFKVRREHLELFRDLKIIVTETLGLDSFPATDEPEYQIIRERYARAISKPSWETSPKLTDDQIQKVIERIKGIEPILLDEELYKKYHGALERHGIELSPVPEIPWNQFLDDLRRKELQKFKATYPYYKEDHMSTTTKPIQVSYFKYRNEGEATEIGTFDLEVKSETVDALVHDGCISPEFVEKEIEFVEIEGRKFVVRDQKLYIPRDLVHVFDTQTVMLIGTYLVSGREDSRVKTVILDDYEFRVFDGEAVQKAKDELKNKAGIFFNPIQTLTIIGKGNDGFPIVLRRS